MRQSVLVGALGFLGSLIAALAPDCRPTDGNCPVFTIQYEPANGGGIVIRACGAIFLVTVAFRYDVQVRLSTIPFGAAQVEIGSISKHEHL